jgi:hypothetical protein
MNMPLKSIYPPLDIVQVFSVSMPLSVYTNARVPNRQALSRRLQDVKSLPEGWTVANNSSCTTLYKVNCNSKPPVVTTYSLVVHDDLTWTLNIASTQVLPLHIPVAPSTLHYLHNVMDPLTVVDGSKLCVGNPDEKYSCLTQYHSHLNLYDHSGNLIKVINYYSNTSSTSTSGTKVIAQRDHSTIRHRVFHATPAVINER